MTDKRKRQAMRLASTAAALVISQPITDYIAEQTPQREGIKDDLSEAGVQGLVWMVSIFIASLIVRQIVARNR
ncbi:MAG: hypothetical protein WA990_15240 [Rubrobacteraceae bacterium]